MMKRILALLLVLLLTLSASAMAAGLSWSFMTDADNSFTSFGESCQIVGYGCSLYFTPAGDAFRLCPIDHGQSVVYNGEQTTDANGQPWCKVEFDGKTGWIPAIYIQKDTVPAATLVPSTPSFTTNDYVIISGGDCNVRAQASLSSGKLGVLYNGMRADCLGGVATDDRGVIWYEINFNGMSGWVSSRYAKLNGVGASSSSSSSSSTSSGYVKATSYKTNLRDEPNLSGEDIGTMNKGQTATYLGKKSTDSRGVIWYKVRFQGKTGWVSSKYTKLYN